MTHYLFISLDTADRDARLSRLKENLFPDPKAMALDMDVIDAAKCSSDKLLSALLAMPAMGAKRLVIVQRADKLLKDAVEALARFVTREHAHVVLVLEAASWDTKMTARKTIRDKVQVVSRTPEKEITVFDMMDAVFAGNTAEGIKILQNVLQHGEGEERVLGGMVWFWSNRAKNRVRPERYKKGLLVLQEADEHLKRSRFPEREMAVETALVKLSLLIRA